MSDNSTIWTSGDNRFDFRINIGDANRLKGTGVDLLNPKTIETAFADPLNVIELIAEITRPQWEQLGWNYEQFADALIAEDGSLPAAEVAVTNALKSFFQRLGRKALAAVVEKVKRAQDVLQEEALERIAARGDAVLQRVQEKAIAELDRKLDELERVGS